MSRGIQGREGKRNAPSLFNVAYQNAGLFWDGRVKSLEELVTHPIQDTLEMGNNWEDLLQQLRDTPEYVILFRKAFDIEEITDIDSNLTSKALAQFQRTLIAGNTRYDLYKSGQIQFSSSEDRGRRIFFDIEDGLPVAECGHCHVEPLFTGQEYFNNGLDEAFSSTDFKDKGRGAITGKVGEMGMFRTPSLRNVALTAPYMHDGRFQTLEEVIDHYISGGHYSENVNPNVRVLDLEESHKSGSNRFLHTLTEIDLSEFDQEH